MRILLVEDDKVISTLVENVLTEEGYTVDHEVDGQAGLDQAIINKNGYSLIILDIMLPSLDGLEICRRLRQADIDVPVLMISNRDFVRNKVEGLEAGADDYVTKPFDITELKARVKAVQRRYKQMVDKPLKIKKVKLNPQTHEVTVDGQSIFLTSLEFRLLHLLMSKAGKIVSRTEIIEKVWNNLGDELFSNAVDVHVRNLRKKIKHTHEDPLIITIRGAGYKFILPEDGKITDD